jgi:uncharacterized protein DUF6228
MSSATLFSSPSSPQIGRLEFSNPVGSGDSFRCTGTLELDGEESGVELEMIRPYREMMLSFFEQLATETSWWPGRHNWRSEFAEMYVAAHKPGSDVVCLDILIQSPPTYEVEWEGTIHVRLDALRLRRTIGRGPSSETMS